ncbi:hypothetical protein INS49_012965 [Diaporthe citri]|uniref:uncharacterized protein n=1 Tax=Diaporthe citri TaxID=83186 RepID=UPI001C809FEF|nr:uncharacterized protein INS49_012965 [Diaporthe citri]KAG6359444.1 hypothetical protein INS49_012965 [Diaporthe citri]
MALCHIPVDSGTYGVGIRIAFYLQWSGMIVTSWALESDALNLKLINALTIAATSVGLILNLNRLQPVEIYIVLLLTCGTLYFTVPIYLWRLVTCCRPWWDPERWTRIKMGWLFRVLTYSMYGVLHFQTICDLIVATTITVAIELVISWNKIKGANDLDSAAQLIPPVITDLLDAYPDMFDLSDLSVPPPASLDGYVADPYASDYYDMASGYYGMHGGDYVGNEVPPLGDDLGHIQPEPPAAAARAAGGSRGASVISEEGFIRL